MTRILHTAARLTLCLTATLGIIALAGVLGGLGPVGTLIGVLGLPVIAKVWAK